MSQETVSVASLNTLHGNVIREAGLAPIVDKDVLMLQEVSTHAVDKLPEKLADVGFNLVALAGKFGLALAVREASGIRYVERTARTRQLQGLSLLEMLLITKHITVPHEFEGRGMLAAKFTTPEGNAFTAATVHPTIVVHPRRRGNQVTLMGLELGGAYYGGALAVGGDMNHWPTPRQADFTAWESVGLSPVELNGTPTWRAINREQKLELKMMSLLGFRMPADPHAAYLDSLLYRDMNLVDSGVIEVDGSDHNAPFGEFAFTA